MYDPLGERFADIKSSLRNRLSPAESDRAAALILSAQIIADAIKDSKPYPTTDDSQEE